VNVLVAGVTGQVGGAVARKLSLLPNVQVRGLTRHQPDPDPQRTYEPVIGDLENPVALRAAVTDCDAVFIASSIDPEQVTQQGNLVRAAAASPLRPKLVKLSGLGTRLDSFVDSGRWHAEIEEEIRATGLPAASLRPNYFMQNLREPLRLARETGELRGQDGVEIAMVDVDDLAAVAVQLLMNRGEDGLAVVTPTGPRSYSFRDVAAVMSDVLGHTVRFEPVTGEDTRARLEASGMHRWHIDIMTQFGQAFARGWGSEVTSDVEELLGRNGSDLATALRSF